ncbi:uncharacterized protein [Prorops nasuta]|uniref:uncharacterized protein n=1 Tax=Prorops nasuta TaxID=863751 RepID=UPI0034CE7344
MKRLRAENKSKLPNDDNKITKLRGLKNKLLKRICDLKIELKEQEELSLNSIDESYISDLLIEDQKNLLECPYSSNKHKKKLVEISSIVNGIEFNDVDKQWVKDNIYKYEAIVVLTHIKFFIELLIDKEESAFQVLDITCHFVQLDNKYIQEVTPWTELLTKQKNFSLFMSAVSDYNEWSALRSKILNDGKTKNYVTILNTCEKGGGISINMHLSHNSKLIYLKLNWVLQFVEKKLKIENFFTITSTKEGAGFVEEYKELLKNICCKVLKRNELLRLWSNLYSSMNQYEEKNFVKEKK